MKKTLTLLLVVMMAAFAFSLTTAPVLAAVNPNAYWGGNNIAENIENDIQLGNRDPRVITANIINIILGFLGIIAVVIILIGGFKWMTAAGNQDRVDEAKKLIAAGAIGLVIVLASFGIAKFVVGSLMTATGA